MLHMLSQRCKDSADGNQQGFQPLGPVISLRGFSTEVVEGPHTLEKNLEWIEAIKLKDVDTFEKTIRGKGSKGLQCNPRPKIYNNRKIWDSVF